MVGPLLLMEKFLKHPESFSSIPLRYNSWQPVTKRTAEKAQIAAEDIYAGTSTLFLQTLAKPFAVLSVTKYKTVTQSYAKKSAEVHRE